MTASEKEKNPPPSLRTNLFWAAAAEPNLGFEYPVSDKWSVGVNAGLKPWPRWFPWDTDNTENRTHWRNFAIVPEVRYYLDQVYEGFFTGADFVYTHYNVGAVNMPLYPEVKDSRDQGSFWAGGLFVGYSWWPWQHIRLELEAGAAVGLAAYDRFDCPHCGTKLAEERKAAVVPKLGLNIAWNPVSRDETERILAAREEVPLAPPVAFVVHSKEVPLPTHASDSLVQATRKLNGPIASLLLAKRYADVVAEVEKDPAVLAVAREDAEAMNAYAVALYFVSLDREDPEGEKRALCLLEEAVERGSDAARENLKGAQEYGPARKEYDAWLKVMKEEK